MRHLRAHVVILLTMSLVGCTAHYNKQVVKYNPYRSAITHDLTGDWMITYRALPETTASEISLKTDRRNQIISEFVWLADDAYYRWEPAFYTSGGAVSTLFDFASLGLTAAVPVANGPKVLGAMATGIQGANSSVSKNFYDSQSRSVIVQKMRQLREAALIRIAAGINKKVSEYSRSGTSRCSKLLLCWHSHCKPPGSCQRNRESS